MVEQSSLGSSKIVIPLHEEQISFGRRTVQRPVRVHVQTVTSEQLLEEQLTADSVEIERIPCGSAVDAVPPVRTEGEVTIIPVVEEVLVVERRLILKEEIHVRRKRETNHHREMMTLRHQQAVIERGDPAELPDDLGLQPQHARSGYMSDETIVAVYDTDLQADLAVRELEGAGVPSAAIKRHSSGGMTTGATGTAAPRETGFWASLFGTDHEHETAAYDRSVAAGATVVTVQVGEQHIQHVMDILERQNPLDIDERSTSDETATGRGGVAPSITTDTSTDASMGRGAGAMPGSAMPGGATGGLGTSGRATTGQTDTRAAVGGTGRATGQEEVIPLAEEQVSVGKRLVNRGTTRIRRFVVETPVEEAVTLRSEHVSVERRPVTGASAVSDADFTDRTIEATETVEEPVIDKTVRIKEEVVINKEATERQETVRDKVRREDVEITREGGTAASTPNNKPRI